MGTRSLTRIYEDGQLLVQLYKQYDGYPSGWGFQLARYLANGMVTNGYPSGAALHSIWNGGGDLAAQLLVKFKDAVGGLYITQPKKSVDAWQDYEYEVHVNGPVIVLDVYKAGSKKPLYHGEPKNLLEPLRAASYPVQ